MGSDDAIQALIPLVTTISGHMVEITSNLGDVKAEISEVKATGEATLVQATKTNGRMTTAEGAINDLKTAVAVLQNDGKHSEHDDERADEERRSIRDTVRNGFWLIASAVAGGAATQILPKLFH